MSNTIKARFAIVVEPNGAWNIAGQSGADDQQMEDWAAEFITYPWEECRLSFGTIEISMPEPRPTPDEIVGEVVP